MNQFHKVHPLVLSMILLLPISGCFGSSKETPEDNEKPVQTGDESTLLLPPE
ncbi:hypothetical protein Pan241w_02480 [Gimesia alba]|uniref:Uncharacterized protein n=1 Tax=Gimesia alba TaxID=2527973 RepID=A0A517R8J5_9PLAN|nr:hypothetical protein [Gimesia alba]QDT40192.1 hypothetical protein Pan241w_02480 [Gimesia alba]